MPAYHIQRSVKIDAPVSKVRPAVDNFDEWPKWSPWLCMEPDAKLNVYGTPGQSEHGYSWEGDLVGAGSMRLASVKEESLDMDLEFLKPFKSTAKVKMEIKPVSEGETEVTWHMDGKMPFFLFFMIKSMKAMIGMDYARGLKMLKEYVETGSVQTKSEIVGIVDTPSMTIARVKAECAIDKINESMQESMPKVHKLADAKNLEVAGPCGASYTRFDIKAQECSYEPFVQIKSGSESDDESIDEIPAGKALKVKHTGSYRHLGNAWGTAMSYQRYKKIKLSKSTFPYELYPNSPEDTPEENLVTEIYLPLR